MPAFAAALVFAAQKSSRKAKPDDGNQINYNNRPIEGLIGPFVF
jgi:hypothetical protein